MNKLKSLIFGAPISKPTIGAYAGVIETLNAYCGPLDGKSILEVGCAAIPDFIAEMDKSLALREAVGINLIAENKQFSPTLRTIKGDVRHMKELADNQFDLIISSSVFEHIQNFDVALEEMHRVLRTGGFLFSHFGPIWSGSYGHHLWIDDGISSITYHTLELPPYCHLLMTPAELEQLLERKGERKSKEIAEFVFHSPAQNQLMFSDYERLVEESRFEKIFLKGYDHPQLQQRYSKKISSKLITELNAKYPADRDRFMYDGITMLLRRGA